MKRRKCERKRFTLLRKQFGKTGVTASVASVCSAGVAYTQFYTYTYVHMFFCATGFSVTHVYICICLHKHMYVCMYVRHRNFYPLLLCTGSRSKRGSVVALVHCIFIITFATASSITHNTLIFTSFSSAKHFYCLGGSLSNFC